MTLRQLVAVAYQALCELLGQEKTDETLAEMADDQQSEAVRVPRVTAAERESRRQLLDAFRIGAQPSQA